MAHTRSAALASLLETARQLPAQQQRQVGALVGAAVADAATRPFHWVYDTASLQATLGTSQPEFWPENKSPFYSVPTGGHSCYNEQVLASLRAFASCGGFDPTAIAASFKSLFGPDTPHAVALAKRKIAYSPEHRETHKGPVEGPWIQKGVITYLENVDNGVVPTGSSENMEFDGFCTALPFIAKGAGRHDMLATAEKAAAILTTAPSALEHTRVMAMLVEGYILGQDDPLESISAEIRALLPEIYFEMQSAIGDARAVADKQLDEEDDSSVAQAVTEAVVADVARYGKACAIPGSFKSAVRVLAAGGDFVEAVRQNIRAGGCNCSRANLIGACLGARAGVNGIPVEWLESTAGCEEVLELAMKVVGK